MPKIIKTESPAYSEQVTGFTVSSVRGIGAINKPGRARRQAYSYNVNKNILDIKKGYSFDRVDELKNSLGLSNELLAVLTGISLTSMHRRKTSGRLTQDESEKIYRLEKLYHLGLEVLEDGSEVISWFNTPQIVLGGKKPIDYADTAPGCEEIERVLRRMEHGTFL